MEVTKPVRRSSFNAVRVGSSVIRRVARTNPVKRKPRRRRGGVSAGALRPRETKKRVMKKSRMPVILAITSRAYGKAAMESPAISAPISFERPIASAVPETRKHQEIDVINISSGDLAIDTKILGRRYLLIKKQRKRRPVPARREAKRGESSGFSRFGCTARKIIAQMS